MARGILLLALTALPRLLLADEDVDSCHIDPASGACAAKTPGTDHALLQIAGKAKHQRADREPATCGDQRRRRAEGGCACRRRSGASALNAGFQCKEGSDTITACKPGECPMGYPRTAQTSGTGLWCAIEQAPKNWTALKTCSAKKAVTIKVLAYNLYWWNLFGQRGGEGGRAGKKIGSTSKPEEYDFMGFQECDDIARVMRDSKAGGLTAEYGTLNGGRAIAMAYNKARWELLGSGVEDVGEDSRAQYFGKRSAQWGRFKNKEGATAFFVNHHGPLPVSTSGGCAGSATAYNIMKLIAKNAYAEDIIILVGDFNAAKSSSRVQTLDKFMTRVYSGTSMGGVDHVYSNCGSSATGANLGSGGSDHDAISAVLKVSASA